MTQLNLFGLQFQVVEGVPDDTVILAAPPRMERGIWVRDAVKIVNIAPQPRTDGFQRGREPADAPR